MAIVYMFDSKALTVKRWWAWCSFISTFIIFSKSRTSLKFILPSLFLSAFLNQSPIHLGTPFEETVTFNRMKHSTVFLRGLKEMPVEDSPINFTERTDLHFTPNYIVSGQIAMTFGLDVLGPLMPWTSQKFNLNQPLGPWQSKNWQISMTDNTE